MVQRVEEGYQVFTEDGGDEIGAVREVQPAGKPEIVVYIENFGEIVVPLGAVRSVRDEKVLIDPGKLDSRARNAIAHAHDSERPGL